MTPRHRVGQVIGPWEVVADHGRSKRGAVIWRLLDRETGRELYLKTWQVIALDREHGGTEPPTVAG